MEKLGKLWSVPYDRSTFLQDRPKAEHCHATQVAARPQRGFLTPPQPPAPDSDAWARIVSGHIQKSKLRFQFTKLPADHIRIIVIRPANNIEDPLELDLYAAPFNPDRPSEALQYQALSYEWGDSAPVNPIILRDFIRQPEDFSDPKQKLQFLMFRAVGRRIFVGANLNAALRHLRHKDISLNFWVDAICINQLDNGEKAHQIEKMADIYNRAYNVCVWLGSENVNAEDGMRFARELNGKSLTKSISEDEESLLRWRCLIELMRSKWFSRRWIIQEIAVARNATVHFGRKIVNWDDLANAFSILDSESETLRKNMQKHGHSTRADLDTLNFIEGCGARKLTQLMLHLVDKNQRGEVIERHKTLEHLVATLVPFASGDPRDLIYALLSIARGNPKDLRPDYQKSVLQVYTDFVKHCIEHSNSLDIICRHWVPVQISVIVKSPATGATLIETRLPTWMSTLEKSAFGPPDFVFGGRRYPDNLVGPPYNACKNSPPILHFGRRSVELTAIKHGLRESYDGTLVARGFILGTVRKLSPRLVPGKLLQEFLEMAGWAWTPRATEHSVRDVPDRLWKTVMADCDDNGQPLEALHRRACLHILQEADIHGDVDIKTMIDDPSTPDYIHRFLKRVQKVLCNRKAFIGGENGQFFGLCSKQAEVNDMICILYGCSVPVILHQVNCKPVLGQRPPNKPLANPTVPSPQPSDRQPRPSGASPLSTPIILEHDSRMGGRQEVTPAPSNSRIATAPHSKQSKPRRKRTSRFSTPASRSNAKRRRTVEPSPPSLSLDTDDTDELSHDHRAPITPDRSSVLHIDGQTDRDEDRPVYYELVGESFVYGYMDGAAMDVEDRAEREQDFVLV